MNLKKVTIRGREYTLGYKVVTMDMMSLGLRKNPNLMKFRIGEWIDLPPDKVIANAGDYGGIWLAISSSAGNGLRKYMLRQYEEKTRMFEAIVRDVLYHNCYRMKTSGIKLLEEIE